MTQAIPTSPPRPLDPSKKLVLFHRDFQRFTGGHLKVWDYFNHVAASPAHEARVAFATDSKWDTSNPWFAAADSVTAWEPEKADILFLAGTDWRALPESKRANFDKPIINLIQHPRHAEKKSELRGHLSHRAIRICVSDEVADAIKQTNEVNGPVFVIPNGIDTDRLTAAKLWDERSTEVLVCGLKAPELARKVHDAVAGKGRTVHSLIDWLPREEYLARVNDARICVFVPRPVEGFYLPPLEGMACGALVVCPDCEGNRGFCRDGVNCFRPDYDAGKIVAATLAALEMHPSERKSMLEKARSTAQLHSLDRERSSFSQILGRVDELWRA